MRLPKASEGPLPEEKLIAWSKQPYGVGFQDVRKLAAELLRARQREKRLNELVVAIDKHGACGAIQEAREKLSAGP
jgi:hypothetical protein